MGNAASAGKIRATRFTIVQNEMDFTATVMSSTETYETTMSCWLSARIWVEKTITRIEETRDEVGRDY